MNQSIRVVIHYSGRFSCSSCMTDHDGTHIEIADWMRSLCLDCAFTVGAKLKEVAAMAKDEKTKEPTDTGAAEARAANRASKPNPWPNELFQGPGAKA